MYGPLLEGGSGGGKGRDPQPSSLDPKLHDLMQQLQAGLGAAVRKESGEQVMSD